MQPTSYLPGQFAPNPAIAAAVVNRIDPDAGRFRRIVVQMEHSQMPHQPRAEKLADEAFVAIIGPDVAQYRASRRLSRRCPETTRDLRRQDWNDPLDVLHHRETERVGIEAGKAAIVEIGLEHHIGVRLQEFQKVAVADATLLVQPVHDAVMHIGRGAFVHDLGLTLRIEILRDVAHDPQQFALPGLQPRRGLFEEVEQVFLRKAEQLAASFDVQQRFALDLAARNGPPQFVECALLVQAPLPGTLFLDTKIMFLLAGIAVDAVRHQGVRGVERPLDLGPAMPLLALRDIALGEIEIVENSVGVGPLLEQIVVLEKMIVAEGGMGDHQGLHGRGIFFHQIGNAG